MAEMSVSYMMFCIWKRFMCRTHTRRMLAEKQTMTRATPNLSDCQSYTCTHRHGRSLTHSHAHSIDATEIPIVFQLKRNEMRFVYLSLLSQALRIHLISKFHRSVVRGKKT